MVQKDVKALPVYCGLVSLGDARPVCGHEKLSHLAKVQMRQSLSSVFFLYFLLTSGVHQPSFRQIKSALGLYLLYE